jgi:imidazolonepropionase-like amidohydrolase
MIAIKGRELIDCTGAGPIQYAVVLVEGDKITDVGTGADVSIPQDAEIIDMGDATILPGLIDAHEHLGLTPGLGYERGQMESPEVEIAFRMARNARTVLKSGVTTVRTCGDKNSLDLVCKKVIEEGFIPGPRVVASGAGIRPMHGHGATATTIADGVEAVRAAVRSHLFSGVDHIKLFVTGGTGTIGTVPWQTYYTRDEIAAAVEEAHNVNKTVSAHCHGGNGADWCIETGLDSIEHGAWCSMEQHKRMAEKGTWLVPTLCIAFREPQPGDKPKPPEVAAKGKEAKRLRTESFPKILDLGIKIAAGTDNLHGMVWRELELFVQLGMEPMAALLTGTKNAAELARKQDSIGTLEKGKLADIIAVNGNPLVDIGCLKNVSLVMKGGKRYELSD